MTTLPGVEFFHYEITIKSLNAALHMTLYESQVQAELAVWKQRMRKGPSFSSQLARRLQTHINRAIPEKIHQVKKAIRP